MAVSIQTLLSSNLPLGYTGSIGYTGSQGYTGSRGDKGDKYKTTSSTSMIITSSGTKNFVIETGLAYTTNQTIKVSYNPSNYMTMNIVSYNDITGGIEATVYNSTGTGTYTSWVVNLEGAVGEVGYTGSQGYTGSSGAYAAVGYTGSQGVGYTGSQGNTGFVGSQGPAGGYTGSAGFTGSQGYTGSGSSVAGSNTQIQYNNNGVLGGSANLTWNQTTTTLTVTGNIYAPSEANASYPGAYRAGFFGSDGFLESNFSAGNGQNVYIAQGLTSGPGVPATSLYLGPDMNLNPANNANSNIYIGGGNNTSQIYLRGTSYLNNTMTYGPAVTGAPTGYTGATYRVGALYSDGTLQSFFSAGNGVNFYLAQGLTAGPGVNPTSLYLGPDMNFNPANSANANIYIGGGNNNSNLYLRSNVYFPNEANASYPGAYRAGFFGSDGFIESNFGAGNGQNVYIAQGLTTSTGPAPTNLYLGPDMNFNSTGNANANIYIGGANNNSLIYLRGVPYFPNEANPAYPGAYRAGFFDSAGGFESNFSAGNGQNVYIAQGLTAGPGVPATSLYLGPDMNLNPANSANANIYIGGANNTSQIYLRGSSYLQNTLTYAPAATSVSTGYTGTTYRVGALYSDGTLQSFFSAGNGVNFYLAQGLTAGPGVNPTNLYLGPDMNVNPNNGASANIYIGGANNNSLIYLRGIPYFPTEAAPTYPGAYRAGFFDSAGGFESNLGPANGLNVYIAQGLTAGPGVPATSLYLGPDMNFNPNNGANSVIYIGGANNNSLIYLRGVPYFPTEAAPTYPGAYRAGFFDSTGGFESNFSAVNGQNIYIAQGYTAGPGVPATNLLIGPDMNMSPVNNANSVIYIGGANNNSLIYLRGIPYFPNEANPAYPGAYRAGFFDSTGGFESNFSAANGQNVYIAQGLTAGPGVPATNLYLGPDMNMSPVNNANANIYIGGANNTSQIYLRGNSLVAPLSGVGNRAVYSNASGSLTNSSSDITHKTNIRALPYGLDEILQLIPVIFNWVNQTKYGSQEELGLIANHVEQIIPELVSTNNDGSKSLDYPKLVAPIIKAIHQLAEKINVLENK